MEQTTHRPSGGIRVKTRAILWMLISSFSFSAMQFVVNLSGERIGTMQQIFCRNIFCGLIAALLMKQRGIPFTAERSSLKYLLGRSIFGFISVFCLFYASRNAIQVDVTIISRTIPIWVTLIAAVILKEKIPKVQLPVIVLCLLGAGIAIRPSFSSNPVPMIVAFIGAIVSAGAYICISRVSGRVNPLLVVLFFSVFSTLAAGIAMLIQGYVSPTAREWGLLALVGVFGVSGQLGVTYAYELASAAEVSIYDYSGIVFSAILGYFILGQAVTVWTAVGAALIIGASLWAYLYNRNR